MELINRKLLLFAQSINIPNFGTVYPPKLRDFLEFDYGKFKSSFSVRKELFIDNTNGDYDKIKDFDSLIFSNMIESLIQSLKHVPKSLRQEPKSFAKCMIWTLHRMKRRKSSMRTYCCLRICLKNLSLMQFRLSVGLHCSCLLAQCPVRHTAFSQMRDILLAAKTMFTLP